MAIKDGDWTLINYDPGTGRSVWEFDHGDGRKTHRIDNPVDQLLKQNAEMLNNSIGQRWGEGRMTYNMPYDLWAQHLKPAADQKDHDYIRRKVNDEFSKFKTFHRY